MAKKTSTEEKNPQALDGPGLGTTAAASGGQGVLHGSGVRKGGRDHLHNGVLTQPIAKGRDHGKLAASDRENLRPKGHGNGAGKHHLRACVSALARSAESLFGKAGRRERIRAVRASWCLCFRMDRRGISARHSEAVNQVPTGLIPRASAANRSRSKAFCSGVSTSSPLLNRRQVGQVGPDALPRLLAKHLPRDCSVRIDLDAARLGWVHVTAPCQALVQVLLVDAELFSPFAPLGGGELLVHDTILA